MNNSKLNILFLTPRLPFPVIGGDRVKPYYLLKHLAKNHNVKLISFYQGKRNKLDEYCNNLKQLGLQLKVIDINPVISSLKTTYKLHRFPLEIAYYYHNSFKKEVLKSIATDKIDIAFSFFMRTAEYLKNIPIKKILIAEDCRTIYQYRSYKSSANLLQKAIRFWEYKNLLRYEPKIMDFFNIITFVTNVDLQEISKMTPQNQHKFRILSNGTDLERFKPCENFHNRNYLIFFGKLDIWANQLTIKRILNNIFPELQKQISNIKLKIVGANPPAWLRKLKTENVEVIPNVPEIIPYLQNARVFIHPHLGGSGIQNKLIEALACGCPAVSTESGIQGIPVKINEDIFIANSDEEFIKYISLLWTDDNLAEKFSKNARECIAKNLSWEKIYKDLDNIINDICN